jgi:hypothetical protein
MFAHCTEDLDRPFSLQPSDDPRNTPWVRGIQSPHAKAPDTTALPSNVRSCPVCLAAPAISIPCHIPYAFDPTSFSFSKPIAHYVLRG